MLFCILSLILSLRTTMVKMVAMNIPMGTPTKSIMSTAIHMSTMLMTWVLDYGC